jgi:hypothetical protein
MNLSQHSWNVGNNSWNERINSCNEGNNSWNVADNSANYCLLEEKNRSDFRDFRVNSVNHGELELTITVFVTRVLTFPLFRPQMRKKDDVADRVAVG